MINFDDLRDLYINAPKQNSLMSFDDLMNLYYERLKKNPQAYEEISDIFIIPKLIFYADGRESEHRANIDWLERLDTLNAVMDEAAFEEAILERWLENVEDMRRDLQISGWASDLAELEDVLTADSSLYWSLRPLIAIASSWEADIRTFKLDATNRQLDTELQMRFVKALQEMRNDEQFRLFYIDLDELITHIDEEDFLVYGLLRIKNVMDDE